MCEYMRVKLHRKHKIVVATFAHYISDKPHTHTHERVIVYLLYS